MRVLQLHKPKVLPFISPDFPPSQHFNFLNFIKPTLNQELSLFLWPSHRGSSSPHTQKISPEELKDA